MDAVAVVHNADELRILPETSKECNSPKSPHNDAGSSIGLPSKKIVSDASDGNFDTNHGLTHENVAV